MGFHQTSNDGVSQRVNSPRFSGPMTRRAHSFKRSNNSISNSSNNNGNSQNSSNTLNTHHEIDLQLNSPRSEIVINNTDSGEGFELILERKQQAHHHVSQRVHGSVLKSLLKKPVVVDFGCRERKKLGHWMFFMFCGVCLFWGVFKICAHGWFGEGEKIAEGLMVLSC